jgi:hypothetical protein
LLKQEGGLFDDEDKKEEVPKKRGHIQNKHLKNVCYICYGFPLSI